MFRQSIIRISMEYFQLSKYLFFYEDINLNRHFWVSCSGPPKFQNNCPPSKSAQNLKSQMAEIKRHIESVHEIYIYIYYIYIWMFFREKHLDDQKIRAENSWQAWSGRYATVYLAVPNWDISQNDFNSWNFLFLWLSLLWKTCQK